MTQETPRLALRARLAQSMRKTLSVALLGLLAACGTMSRMEVDGSGTAVPHFANNGELRPQIDALVQPLIEQKRTPGMVVGVLFPDGSRQTFGYGTTATVGGHRPDAETLFAIGSVSKGFLGATAAVLVQEGVLSWDDTLEQLLPPGTVLSAAAKEITLLQLATHTSGLPRQPFTPTMLAYLVQYLFTGENFYRHLDRDFLLNYLRDFDPPSRREPRYSNIGYGLLGYALELRTGKKVDALVSEKLLLPLQLNSTSYSPERLPGYNQHAYGHAGDQPKLISRGRPVPDWRFTDVLTGSAALYSDVNDLLSYAAAHLHSNGDPVLDAALRDTLTVRMQRPIEAPAIAWIVDEVDGHKISYQIGLVAGYTSYVGLDIDNKTAVVVLQNSFNWSNSVGHRLLLRMAPGDGAGDGERKPVSTM